MVKGDGLMISIGNRAYLLLLYFILIVVLSFKAQEVKAATFKPTTSQEIKNKIITANSSDKPVIVNFYLGKNYKSFYFLLEGYVI